MQPTGIYHRCQRRAVDKGTLPAQRLCLEPRVSGAFGPFYELPTSRSEGGFHMNRIAGAKGCCTKPLARQAVPCTSNVYDSREHKSRILCLADQLLVDGFNAIIDQFVRSPDP